jgi:hypothetical protein
MVIGCYMDGMSRPVKAPRGATKSKASATKSKPAATKSKGGRNENKGRRNEIQMPFPARSAGFSMG